MTESDAKDKTTEAGEGRQRWVEEVQEALDRTGDAIRTAWEATRESRMSALESAKQAAQELGEVIDKGIAAAKERWSGTEPAHDAPAPGSPPTGDAATEPAPGDITVTPVETETTDQP